MSKYFINFPKTVYSLEDKIIGVDTVTNIVSRFSMEQAFKSNSSVYEKYNIQDSDTPEIIAAKYYDQPERHWLVLAMNDIVDPQYDWPLDYRTFISYVKDKYSANASVGQTGLEWAQGHTHSYILVETRTTVGTPTSIESRVIVDANTYANTATSTSTVTLKDNNQVKIVISKETQSYYDYENEENENKRQIKLLKKEFAYALEQELIEVFNR
jgi:hypothetical protein